MTGPRCELLEEQSLKLEPRSLRGFAIEWALSLEKTGRPACAARLMRSAARRLPADGEVRFLLAQLLERMDRPREASRELLKAQKILSRSLKRDGRSSHLRLVLARAALQQRRFRQAELHARGALALSPADEKARCLLSEILVHQEKVSEAERILNEAAALDNASAEVSALLGRLKSRRMAQNSPPENSLASAAAALKTAGRFGEAAKSYRAALRKYPGSLRLSLGLGEILLLQGKVSEMFALLRRAGEPSAPGEGVPYGREGASRWQTAVMNYRRQAALLNFAEAARIAESLLDVTNDYECVKNLPKPFLVDQFDLHPAPRSYKKASLAAARRVLRESPDLPWGVLYRLMLHKIFQSRGKEYPEASSDRRRLESFCRGRYGWLGQALGVRSLCDGDFRKAMDFFKTAAEACSPLDWVSACYRAEAMACDGRAGEALREFAQVLSRARPECRGAVLAWKGEILLWIGRSQQALRCFNEALRLGALYAHGWKGGALVRLGRWTSALQELDRAIALQPNDLESRLWKVEALFRLGKYARALRELKAAEPLNDFEKSIYYHALRALVRGARGDDAGMRRDCLVLSRSGHSPPALSCRLGRLRGLRSEEQARVLEDLLAASRGVRRGNYEYAVWLNL